MNIYVSHATNFDFQEEWYLPLKKNCNNETINFVFPHEKSLELFNTKEFFESKKCDVILAEVSFPSTGQGIELGWANMMNIPIICIHKSNTSPSNSLKAVSKILIPYEDIESIVLELEKHINQLT
jgi:hypothetical protein